MRRKTPKYYHILAEKRGFIWLGPEVRSTQIKTRWECEQRHRWEATYAKIWQGSGCPFCYGLTRKVPADYHALAWKRGFRWLGPEATNTLTKTWWECEKGHRWETCYSHIQQGRGCPVCAGRARKTPADYHTLAKKRGFRWLGPEVTNTQAKTVWECKQGHKWEACHNNIQKGRSCPVCSGKAPKTPKDYRALAEKRGFHWSGPEVPNVATKTEWECEQGHRWKTRYHDIQQGSGCPFCSGRARKTPADYHALAEERCFRWSGPEVPNIQTRTGWECKQGHRWEAPYRSIQQGSGCPVCASRVAKIFPGAEQ